MDCFAGSHRADPEVNGTVGDTIPSRMMQLRPLSECGLRHGRLSRATEVEYPYVSCLLPGEGNIFGAQNSLRHAKAAQTVARGFARRARRARPRARRGAAAGRGGAGAADRHSRILRVVSKSPTDPQPVFESVVLTAARLLHCTRAFVLLCDGDAWSVAAAAAPEGVLTPRAGRTPIDPNANFPSRAILAKEKLYVPDFSLVELPEFERTIRKRYGANCASSYRCCVRGNASACLP